MRIIQRAVLGLAHLLAKSVGFTTTSDLNWLARNGYQSLYQILGGGLPAYTGKAINVETAMKCSVVWACTRAITEAIASMPLPILRKSGDSTITEKKHSAYNLLAHAPNEYTTAQRFRATLTHHALNYGNGYARIVRQSGTGKIIALYPIHPSQMVADLDDGGTLTYRHTLKGGEKKIYPASEIFHLANISDDGIGGIGAVESGRQAIALALALEQYGSLFFARGGMPAGALKKAIPFKENTARDEFREQVDKTYQSIDNAHKWLILEGEWDWKSFGVDPEKAQFVLVRQFMVSEICRYYNISPHLAADLSRATFSNIEHLALEFIQLTLLPWMTLWEQTIFNKLFTERERDQGYYAKHNANALMRGDFATRMSGYATSLQNGIFSINDVLELEDRDPVEGGDAHHIQLNMQTVPGTGEPTSAEASKTQANSSLVTVSDGSARKPKVN